MSAYMRDWIGPLVERELGIASEGLVLAARSPNSYLESGTLIVHLTEGKSLQINEVSLPLKFPVLLIIGSSSITLLNMLSGFLIPSRGFGQFLRRTLPKPSKRSISGHFRKVPLEP